MRVEALNERAAFHSWISNPGVFFFSSIPEALLPFQKGGPMRPRPELTAAVRLPVVVFSAEGHAVEVSALLLSEVAGPCGTGL